MRALVACVALAVSASAFGADGPEQARVGAFSVRDARITDLARKLARAARARICVEELPLPGGDARADTDDSRPRPRPGTAFTLALEDATVADVLDEVVRAEPGYTWSIDEGASAVNVYPRVDAPLSWTMPDLTIEDEAVGKVIAANFIAPGMSEEEVWDAFGIRWSLGDHFHAAHDVLLESGMGNTSWLQTRVSLRTKGLTARQALNRLAAQLGFVRWELVRLPRSCRVGALARFDWYYGSKPIHPPTSPAAGVRAAGTRREDVDRASTAHRRDVPEPASADAEPAEGRVSGARQGAPPSPSDAP